MVIKMAKKLVILLGIIAALVFAVSCSGALEYVLARTVFSPNYPGNSPVKSSITVHDLEIVAENLDIPWEIIPLSDGRMIVTERPGRIVLLENGNKTVIKELSISAIGEGGLLGAALESFDDLNYLYVYYTYRSGISNYNRISRFLFDGSSLGDEQVLLEKIPGSSLHNGGRMRFGNDGKLYVTTGDALTTRLAQDEDSLAGKVLRLNPDGSVPDDNPFPESYVYALGLRNPQGLAWHPVTGDLYLSGHGPTRRDHITVIEPGLNYGWPTITCDQENDEFAAHLICYQDFTLAPSGMDFVNLVDQERVFLLVSGLRGNMVMVIELDQDDLVVSQTPILTDLGRIRTVVFHDGYVYIATNNTDGRGIPDDNSDVILRFRIE